MAAGLLLWVLGAACGGGPAAIPAMPDLSLSDAASCDGCAGDGGSLPLYASCTTNAQCQSQLCHLFMGMGVARCTRACVVDADCPPPSPGCSKTGLCRIP